jgi:hypothetical protein
VPFSYLGDLIRIRPEEARKLIFRTYRVRGCSTTETARALGTGKQAFRALVRAHGLADELRRIRDARDRIVGVVPVP